MKNTIKKSIFWLSYYFPQNYDKAISYYFKTRQPYLQRLNKTFKLAFFCACNRALCDLLRMVAAIYVFVFFWFSKDTAITKSFTYSQFWIITNIKNYFFVLACKPLHIAWVKTERKDVKEESDLHGKSDKSITVLHYYIRALHYSIAWIYWKFQGFPIRINSTIKDTSVWKQMFWRVLVHNRRKN